MFRFPNRPDTCYERAINPSFPFSLLLTAPLSPSLPEMFWLHERGARINFSLLHFLVSFRSFLFFLTHSPVKFPRQTDNTDGSLRKSLVRAKAKSDDLSLSPKATSKNFLFTFYTYKESLSLSCTHARTHSHMHFLSNQCADVRDE